MLAQLRWSERTTDNREVAGSIPAVSTNIIVYTDMKTNAYKKTTTKECAWCDYRVCRKGHKCSWYKKYVKQFNKKGRYNEVQE